MIHINVYMYSDLTEYSLFSWILCWPGTFFKQYWKMLIQWNQIFYGHIVSPVFGWECFQILREIWGGGEIQPFPEIIHWPRHPAWLWVRCSEPHGHLHCLTAGGEPVFCVQNSECSSPCYCQYKTTTEESFQYNFYKTDHS